ncbi:methionine--tRNA ligase [Lentisphaerota bacterium ZTH]|nr:methionine--tRNA ligase [Lentisphaerota bacterium]WET07712.1 methionine--tRNA ligase [Lentisphaerota bacterium ZTH]
MSQDKFYVTTPIYYVNDKPHIGHAYTTILADVLARYNRSLDLPTFFLTGTDEHGQKVQKAAEAKGISPLEQCNDTVVRFQELWRELEITNDKFIRTTDTAHKQVVQDILQDLFDRDLIYKDEYSGFYCVPCERFFTEKDLDANKCCPECQREIQEIIESNYFFRMSQYQEWLIDYIKTHPEFIQPAFRANETLGFLKQPLGDLCISRPKSRLAWGIELPFDKDYVCYVWFDALINYISGIGYKQDDAHFNKWWPASYHLIGKDILTTHTVYWPTMMKAIGIELPETIFAHGWWLTGRDKMSKSLGNVVNPMEMIQKYGVDAFRYFLMAEMTLGQDASFTEEAFVNRYNSDLANDLGNLLSRVVKMNLRHRDGLIPQPNAYTDAEKELMAAVDNAVIEMEKAICDMRLNQGIEHVMNAVRAGNRYMEQTAPWTLAKKGDNERLDTVLYCAAEALRKVSVLLHPVMPGKMADLRKALGLSGGALNDIHIGKLKKSENILSGLEMNDIDALFLRVKLEEIESVQEAPEKKQKKKQKSNQQPAGKNELPEGVITVDDFFKTELKTAKILEAEKVKGADKLLRLQIEVGKEKRQLIAGIAEFYTPEEVVGKTIVVVANLKPAKIRGVESQGMLLAAKTGKELKIVTVDGDISSGASVG